MALITATGTWVSRRHAIWGTGTVIVTSRGVARTDTVEMPLDESKTKHLMLGSRDGGMFNGREQPPQATPGAATETDHPIPPPPTSTLAVTPTASVPPTSGPLVVNFDAGPSGGTGPYTYAWDFGDGATSALSSPSHTYAQPGSFTVSVAVTDATGFVRTTTFTVNVSITLSAVVTAVPVDGSVPLTVQLNVVPSNGTSPYTYSWDFGDGSPGSVLQNPVHTYDGANIWLPTVTVTDATGHQIRASMAVEVAGQLVSMPWAIPNIGPVGLPVTFVANVHGGTPPYQHYWDFGDGGYATVQDPTHVFMREGFYNVNLLTFDSYGRYFSTYVAVNIGPVTLMPPLDPYVLPLELQQLFTVYGWTSTPIL